jgi:hypothetical protein
MASRSRLLPSRLGVARGASATTPMASPPPAKITYHSLLLSTAESPSSSRHGPDSVCLQAGEPVPGHSICTDVREHSEIGASHGCDLFIRKKFLEASALLVDGCFTVGWEICVERASPPQHLLDTDVTFEVGGEAFSAHRSVLAARSPVLEAELFFTRRGSAPRQGIAYRSMVCCRRCSRACCTSYTQIRCRR